ncbi:thioredoxin family protein [Flavobacteriaceae bacterium]|jgi:thiol-disulfide isomerase/thioredoxin|nr:thioredoxin family protein [Bacteroidota bacterium]MDB4180386.1 thioredoxin family protein [Flavobacteriaceae bacterium]|tara:strand:- start:350 stop:910 length:561 start_codon:yes stop_codon:yes gene_type:complete
MARTNSNMVPLGTEAKDFKLYDTVSKTVVSFDQIKGSLGTLVLFICNHCPFVIHINPILIKISKKYKKSGLNIVAISSNDVEKYPQDGPLQMAKHAKKNGYDFPYLFDETQEVAKIYDAACTPDIYLYNYNNRLVYKGQIDDSRPGNNIPINGNDLVNAIECLINKVENKRIQKPSIGCNIKWKVN